MHLTDEQLNEYLDNETNERVQIELHLNSCNECNARFSDLQNLFFELESLPKLELTRDLSIRFITTGELTLGLPRWLTLTVALQAALALIALFIAVPFVSTMLSTVEILSFTSWIFELQIVWTTWLDLISTLQLPTIPEFPIPIIEMSSLLLSLLGISVLWILGNGILLRNQIRKQIQEIT